MLKHFVGFSSKVLALMLTIALSSTILTGCGGGGGSMTSVNSSTTGGASVQVNTPTQQQFIAEAENEYNAAPNAPVANFKMAIAESFKNQSSNSDMSALSQNAQTIAPSIVGVLNAVFNGYNAPVFSVSDGINFMGSALKLNSASAITVGSLQDTLQLVIIPLIDREIMFLRKAETAEFKFETTRAYFKGLISGTSIKTLDNTRLIIDRSDIFIIDGVLSIAKGFIHFACAFNFDAANSGGTYNDTTNILKLREFNVANGKGVTNLKLAYENIALGFKSFIDAFRIRKSSNVIIPSERLFWASSESLDLAVTEFTRLYNAITTSNGELRFPEILSDTNAYLKINLIAWTANPSVVDLKTFAKAVMSLDENSKDTTAYDYTLGGLFPEFTSKEAVKNKISTLKAIKAITNLSFLQKFFFGDTNDYQYQENEIIAAGELVAKIEKAYKTKDIVLFNSLFTGGNNCIFTEIPAGAENIETIDYVYTPPANRWANNFSVQPDPTYGYLGIIAKKHNHPMMFKVLPVKDTATGKYSIQINSILNYNNTNLSESEFFEQTQPAFQQNRSHLEAGNSTVIFTNKYFKLIPSGVVSLGLSQVKPELRGPDGSLVILSGNYDWNTNTMTYYQGLICAAGTYNASMKAKITGRGLLGKYEYWGNNSYYTTYSMADSDYGWTYIRPFTSKTYTSDKDMTVNFTQIPSELEQNNYQGMTVNLYFMDANNNYVQSLSFSSDISNINNTLKAVINDNSIAQMPLNLTVEMIPFKNNYYNTALSYKLVGKTATAVAQADHMVFNIAMEKMTVNRTDVVNALTNGTWEVSVSNLKFNPDMTYEFYPDKANMNVKESGTFEILINGINEINLKAEVKNNSGSNNCLFGKKIGDVYLTPLINANVDTISQLTGFTLYSLYNPVTFQKVQQQ
ncbi:MAG: hypothetical protein QMC67_10950 [Candidatus Wallbacteria bacterium]